MVYLRSSQAYAYINWDLRNEKLDCFGTSNMPLETYVSLWSTVYVACHRWINHMSDKASKGLALFTIVLKYAQICLKPRKGATSGADTKSLTSTFTKNEGIDLWLEHLNWNNLCHMIVYSPSTVSSLNISLQNMKALWVKLKIWCTNFVHLIFPWICDAFFVWEHSLLCQYLCTFPLKLSQTHIWYKMLNHLKRTK